MSLGLQAIGALVTWLCVVKLLNPEVKFSCEGHLDSLFTWENILEFFFCITCQKLRRSSEALYFVFATVSTSSFNEGNGLI